MNTLVPFIKVHHAVQSQGWFVPPSHPTAHIVPEAIPRKVWNERWGRWTVDTEPGIWSPLCFGQPVVCIFFDWNSKSCSLKNLSDNNICLISFKTSVVDNGLHPKWSNQTLKYSFFRLYYYVFTLKLECVVPHAFIHLFAPLYLVQSLVIFLHCHYLNFMIRLIRKWGMLEFNMY